MTVNRSNAKQNKETGRRRRATNLSKWTKCQTNKNIQLLNKKKPPLQKIAESEQEKS